MRALVPIVYRKAQELTAKWKDMVEVEVAKNLTKQVDNYGELVEEKVKEAKIDVCHWVSRATFDVIGVAGPSYTSVDLRTLSRRN